MKYYRFSARLLAPIMVQENRQSNTPRGLPYVPGASFRGAMAATYLRTRGDSDDPAFQEIFIKEPVSFPDLLPSDQAEQMAYPLAATACSCKRFQGFKNKNAHGVGDALAAMTVSGIRGRPVVKALTCHVCGQDMKSLNGFWNGNVSTPKITAPVLVYQRHTGISRSTGTIAPSVFYTTEGIAEFRKEEDGQYHPQYVTGGAFLTGSQYDILKDWLQENLFVGADRTRGMGEIAITLEAAKPPEFDIETWNRKFRQKVERLNGQAAPEGVYFSLGFSSHAILVDRFLRAQNRFIPQLPGLETVLQVIRPHLVRGWQSSWQLPKPEDPAMAMGGVCLFKYLGNDIHALKTRLHKWNTQGIGLRRAEGFGRVHICDQLHIQEVL